MKPGQVVARWWQWLVQGRLRSPQDLVAAAQAEFHDGSRAEDAFFERQVDGFDWSAPERLKAPGFMTSTSFLRQWDKADWQYVDGRLMRFSALLIEAARKRGIPLYVHGAFRTQAEQEAAFKAGNSKVRWPNGAHCIGEAVDIVHGVLHWDMTRQEWDMIHQLGLRVLDRMNAGVRKDDRLHLTWGGDWRFYDPAHWEISDYRSRTRPIQAGPPIRRTPRAILRMRL